MTAFIKNTPIAFALHNPHGHGHAQDTQAKQAPVMGQHHGMEVALSFDGATAEKAHKQVLGVTDVSCFAKFGIKGPNAAKYLAEQGLKTPDEINAWVEGAPGTLVLRLGGSEFLIEDQLGGTACTGLASFNQANTAGAYQVAHADSAFILSGSQVLNLLSELCVMDLRDSALASHAVVMTQVAGISVTLMRESLAGEQVYRMWCDASYGPYLWEMLLEIAQELGGGAVGLTARFQ
jgi:sarcosine oxidase subunit gamma